MGDGRASAEWASKCAAGAYPPSPFEVHGEVGEQGEFRLSAVREWLCWRQQQNVVAAQQREPKRQCGRAGEGACNAGSGSMGPLEETVARPGAGGHESLNAEAFVERLRPKGCEGAAMPQPLQSLVDGDLEEGERVWREVMVSMEAA